MPLWASLSCDKATSQWLISPLASRTGPARATGTLRLCAVLSCMVWLTIKKELVSYSLPFARPILYLLPDLQPEQTIMPSPIWLPAASPGATVPLVPHCMERWSFLSLWTNSQRWHTLCPCLNFSQLKPTMSFTLCTYGPSLLKHIWASCGQKMAS